MTDSIATLARSRTTAAPPRSPRRALAGLAVAAALVALTGCSDDGGSDSTSTEDLVEAMVDNGAPEEQATCIAEKLEGVTVSELEEFMSAVEAGEDVEATTGVAKDFLNANAACNLTEE